MVGERLRYDIVDVVFDYFFLLGINISVKIGTKYCTATQAQCYADALADAVACASSGRQGFDESVGYLKFDEMAQYCAKEFKYPVSFDLKMNNDNVWVTCTYEYPWLAAGPSNSVFDFLNKYPKATKKALSLLYRMAMKTY